MEIDETAFTDCTVDFVNIRSELHPVSFYHIRRPAGACRSIVAMFCNLISCTGNNEARTGRDVKCVFTVATRAYDVYILVAVQLGMDRSEEHTSELQSP